MLRCSRFGVSKEHRRKTESVFRFHQLNHKVIAEKHKTQGHRSSHQSLYIYKYKKIITIILYFKIYLFFCYHFMYYLKKSTTWRVTAR